MGNNTGYACCKYCGAEFRLFTIFNRDMDALCKIWRRRHERGCAKRTPVQRRKWAKRYEGLSPSESSLVVDLTHPGFIDESMAHRVTSPAGIAEATTVAQMGVDHR